MKFKKYRNIFIACAMAALLVVGGVFAYLTDHDEATNILTMGDVDIGIDEPEYPGNDTPETTDIWAGKVIAKDPMITNYGDNSAYVYLQVSVPKAEVITTDNDGYLLNEGEPTLQQLFSFINEDGEYGINDGWLLIASQTDDTDYPEVNHYLFAYETVLAAYDAENDVADATVPLFNKIEFVNVIEGQIPTDASFEIPIVAHGIQSNYGDGSETVDLYSAWNFYAHQNDITLFGEVAAPVAP